MAFTQYTNMIEPITLDIPGYKIHIIPLAIISLSQDFVIGIQDRHNNTIHESKLSIPYMLHHTRAQLPIQIVAQRHGFARTVDGIFLHIIQKLISHKAHIEEFDTYDV